MFVRKNTFHRQCTYLNKECFKLMIYAPTKERSEAMAQWLTGSTHCIRGIYGCPHYNSQLITFFRWPDLTDRQATTVAIEGILAFVDNEDEWKLIEPYIRKYSYIPFLVIVSHNDLTRLALKNNAYFFKKETTNEGIKLLLDELDKKELSVIKEKFLRFDNDGSGYLEAHELKQIAASINENPDGEDFKKAIAALDFNEDGKFSFTEFIAWWKIGRQNTHTLPKVYEFNQKISQWIRDSLDFAKYEKEMKDFNAKKVYSECQQKVYFKSPGEFRIRSFIELSLAIGGQKRIDTAIQYLSQFTTNTSSSKNNWISLLFTLNPKIGLDSKRAKLLLDESYRNFINWVETSISKDLALFLKNLLIFETSASDNAVIMVCRFKIDIEDIIKGSLTKLLFIFHNLADEKHSTWLNLIVHSNTDLYNDRDKIITLKDFLNVSELEFLGNGSKIRNSIFLDSLNNKVSDTLAFLKMLLLPKNVEIDYKGDLSELIDSSTQSLLGLQIQSFGKFLEVMKKVVVTELLEASTDLQIGINTFDLFLKLKFTSPTIFSMSK